MIIAILFNVPPEVPEVPLPSAHCQNRNLTRSRNNMVDPKRPTSRQESNIERINNEEVNSAANETDVPTTGILPADRIMWIVPREENN